MCRRHRLLAFALLSLGTFAVIAPRAWGQRPGEFDPNWRRGPGEFRDGRARSHGPIPGGGKIDPTRVLPQRLDQARQLAQAQELLGQSLQDPKLLQKWLEGLDAQKQQALLDLAEAVNKGKLGIKPDHAFLQQLQKIAPDLDDPDKLLGKVPENLQNELKELLEKTKPPDNPAVPSDTPADAAASPGQANPGSSGGDAAAGGSASQDGTGTSDPNDKLTEWLLKQVGDNPELARIVQDLARYRPGADGGMGGVGEEVLRRVAAVLPESRFWTDKVLPKIRELPLPTAADLKLPSVDLTPPSLPAVDMPSFAVPAPPSLDVGYGWLAVPALALLVLLGWKVYQERVRGAGTIGGEGAGSWRLGPWPVAPGEVASRADLIRAFEHLSLLRLGPEARTWNHRDIAAVLGGDSGESRQAAEHLASLYEQARYAPAREPWPADALPAARRELIYLAEVAAL